jgi:TPR repeat protein
MLLESGDARAAFACFRHAADGGDRDGHNMLGRCFENGWGTAKDFAQAVRHYRIAAEAGLGWAQYNLGHMLLSGSGVARNREAAFVRYRQAATQGHIRAMNLMGRCCEQGWGVMPSLEHARVWYRYSAQGGYFRGAYNYADMIAAEGCIAGAHYWFARAVRQAPEPARSVMLRSLAARPVFQALATREAKLTLPAYHPAVPPRRTAPASGRC